MAEDVSKSMFSVVRTLPVLSEAHLARVPTSPACVLQLEWWENQRQRGCVGFEMQLGVWSQSELG